MRVGVVSTFYPNAAEPMRAVFIQNLVAAVAKHAETTVVAPIPYFPGAGLVRSRARALRAVPSQVADESRPIFHPRYLAIPKLGALSGVTYFAGILPTLRTLVRGHRIEVLHAHCAYPDAVGVAQAASALGLPFAVTTHGTDINVGVEQPVIRRQVAWALRRAGGVIAVSAALRTKVRELLPDVSDKVVHIPCAAIDPGVFGVRDRIAARRSLGFADDARIVLFAGRLVPIKAVDVLVRAWEPLVAEGCIRPNDALVIVGEGPERARLEAHARSRGLLGTVRFVGELTQEQLATWFSAATVFCLPSRNEGTPNVVVEALASGRPVVASRVGGLPELVTERRNGLLVAAGSPELLARALASALAADWDEPAIAASVAHLTWDNLASRNLDVLRSVLAERRECTV